METIVAIPASPEKQLALGLKNYRPHPDALEMLCQSCVTAVLVGPSSVRKLYQNKSLRLVCLACARGRR
jgi:hypothetical protein